MEIGSLRVDLSDPAAVRSKLDEVDETLIKLEKAIEAREAELERWVAARAALRSLAGLEPAAAPVRRRGGAMPPRSSRAVPVQDLVVDAVRRAGGEVRARQVLAMLLQEGHEVTAAQVGNALWCAAEKARLLRRPRRGFYVAARRAR
jgi:hypothetical protein